MSNKMSNKYFTLYWSNGTRTVVRGETIEAAYVAAKFNEESLKSLDWYDNGVTESCYWNQKEWVKYEAIRLSANDPIWKAPADVILRTLEEYIKKHHEIVVQFDSKDEISLELGWGGFATLGPVKYLEVSGAEYCQGTYGGGSDNEENAYHFMVVASEYFSPTDIELACKALRCRVLGSLASEKEHSIFRTSGLNKERLEDIAAQQKHFD